jgi:Flp pilus assembly protein TadD
VYERINNLKKAEKIYRAVLAKHPGHLSATRQLALLCLRTKRAAEADTLFRAAEQAHPESIQVQLDLAMVDERLGRAAEAEARYRTVLAPHRYHPVALNNLAFLLATAGGPKLEEADVLARRAFRLSPDEPHVVDTLGWIAYQQGAYELAAERFLRAIALKPDAPQFHYHLGLAYMKLDRKTNARLELNTALKDPEFSNADAARAALQSLQ